VPLPNLYKEIIMSQNPENKCAQLWNNEETDEALKDRWDNTEADFLDDIFTMQKSLQERYNKDPALGSLRERTNSMMQHKIFMDAEFTELIERLPFKTWKNYPNELEADFLDEEHKLECWYEWVDMFHFFINIGLALGIDAKSAFKLYYTKNKENFDRQDRGY